MSNTDDINVRFHTDEISFNQISSEEPGDIDVNNTTPPAPLNIPLSFFYTRDSGLAIPTVYIPPFAGRINVSFRNWDTLERISEPRNPNPRNPNRVLDITSVKYTGPLETCAICMDNCETNNDIVLLPCKHIFHLNCVKEWVTHNPVCPLCRATIPHKYSTLFQGMEL